MYSSNDGHSEPTAVKGDDAEYKSVMDRYKKAKGRWNNWQDVWEEIYDYVLPHRESFFQEYSGQRRTENIYDETAVVGLPKFASRLQLGFFPPNGRAFKLAPGPEFPKEAITKEVLGELEQVTDMLHEGLRNSNFNAEFHEGLQDLGIGTMNLLVQPGRFNGDLHFTAVPMTHLALNAGGTDNVSDWFRWMPECDLTEVKHRFPQAKFTKEMTIAHKRDPKRKTKIIEATCYDQKNKFKDEWTYYIIPNYFKPNYFASFYSEIDDNHIKFLNDKKLIDRKIVYGIDKNNYEKALNKGLIHLILDYESNSPVTFTEKLIENLSTD